jgi:acetyl-CoA carboxylase beta subunit
MRGALLNRKPGWSGTGKGERKDKEEKRNGKAKQPSLKVHFSPCEKTNKIIPQKNLKINHRICFGWTFMFRIRKKAGKIIKI